MTRKITITLATATACLALPAVAAAQDYAQETIEVRAISPMADWQKDTTASLNKALARSVSIENANESVVQVGFKVGLDGKAEGVHVLPGSGNKAAQRAAKFAVNNLDTLDELPLTSNGRPILANIIFYKTDASRDRLIEELKQSERIRMSDATMSDYILIGAAPMRM